MQFKIDNFIIEIEVKKESKREYYYFSIFGFSTGKGYREISTNLFDVIDFIELLKSFIGNKLSTEKSYKIANSSAQIKQRHKENFLHFSFKFGNEIYLDKFECSKLAAKLQKVIQKVDIYG